MECPKCRSLNVADAIYCQNCMLKIDNLPAGPSRFMPSLAVFFSFKGRTGRSALIVYGLLLMVLLFLFFVAISLLSILVYHFTGFSVPGGSVAVTMLLFVWSILALGTKRYHDRDKSGLWMLLVFIPLIGWPFVILELLFFKGTSGPNRFGLNPLQKHSS